jgi:predicted O-methyltransferase YrrM
MPQRVGHFDPPGFLSSIKCKSLIMSKQETRVNASNQLREFRSWVSSSIREYQFHRCMRRISAVAPGKFPETNLIWQLFSAWSNQSYGADPEYLEEVIRIAATTSESILECGSGLTTILLGLFATRRGIPVWTLEHNADWYKQTLATLSRYGIDGVELLLTPLRSYDGFSWYDPPLDRMPKRFGTVVCDGPPKKTTPGDRYGLLPVMRNRLGSGTVILLDDVEMHNPDPVLSRWVQEVSTSYDLYPSRASSYAVVTLH